MKNELKEQKRTRFVEVFISSINEYRGNFKSIFKFMLLFIGLPILMFDIANSVMFLLDKRLFSILMNPTYFAAGIVNLPFYYNFVHVIIGIIFFFSLVFMISGFINTSLKKSHFSFQELKINAKQRYWKFCLFIIVYAIFIFLFSVLLIIPGIIFGVYWVLAIYIFLDKKEKILPSLKKSRLLVKNNWWKIFGCILLILIAVVILFLGKFMFVPFDNIYQNNIAGGIPTSFSFLAIYSFLMDVYSFIECLILIPIVILFFKNLYLKLNERGKK
jgi:hypothetical protein